MAVLIEKEIVDGAIDIIVMRDVAACTLGGVELHDPTHNEARGVESCGPVGQRPPLSVACQNGKQIVDPAAFHAQAATHIPFTKSEMGINEQSTLEPFTGDARHDWRASSVTIAVRLSLRVYQCQVARANDPTQQQVEQPVHCATASVRPLIHPPQDQGRPFSP